MSERTSSAPDGGSTAAPGGTGDLLDELVDDDERALVEHYLGRTRFDAGAYLLRRGERDRALYLVRRGTVEIILDDDGDSGDGDEGSGVVVDILAAPEVLGEVAFFDAAPRSATVRARTDGEIDRLSWESFQELTALQPELASRLLLALGRTLARRLRAAEQR